MRILHIHDAPGIPGGATAYLRRLTRALEKKGQFQSFFTIGEGGDALLAPLAQAVAAGGTCTAFVYPRPASPLTRRRHFHHHEPRLAAQLRDCLASVRPDLIHVQNVAAFPATVYGVLAEAGLPVVRTVHDYGVNCPDPGPFWLQPFQRASLRRWRSAMFRAVDRYLIPSRALLEAAALPEDRAELLRLPLDAPPEPGPASEGNLCILFAGTLFTSKGVDVLLRAVAAAGGAARSSRLAIAGQGDQEDALRALCRKLDIETRVDFLGQLQPDAMQEAYRACHLLVLPSLVPENSPLTVLEAASYARPSVVSEAGGSPELVAPPSRGWVFPTGDEAALARILEEAAANPAEIRLRGKRARAYVLAEHDPNAHWERVLQVYQELTQ